MNLALVLFDSPTGLPIVARYFEDLFGPPVVGERAGYNLPPDTPLTRQPLFRAAFLPLDFADSGEDRANLLALFRSPYYGVLAPHGRKLCQREWAWLEKGVERGFEGLMRVPAEAAPEVPDECDASLVARPDPPSRRRSQDPPPPGRGNSNAPGPVSGSPSWPVNGTASPGEACGMIIDRLASEYSGIRLRRNEFSEWIRAAGERSYVERTGFEDAGIQIMSGLEVRGLAFGKVYAAGLVAGALPQPARSLPLLSPDERKRVQGGNAEGQFEFGKRLYGHPVPLPPRRLSRAGP